MVFYEGISYVGFDYKIQNIEQMQPHPWHREAPTV